MCVPRGSVNNQISRSTLLQALLAQISISGVSQDVTRRDNMTPEALLSLPKAEQHAVYSRALERARCALAHSRTREDVGLLSLLHAVAGHQPGTFVEIGAFDGNHMSQTWVLEHCMGWRGVLIEANPENYGKLLRANRSSHTVRVNSAVCNSSGTVEVTAGGGTVAGVTATMAKSFRSKWSRFQGNKSVLVPCDTLPRIMERAGFSTVHYLSLDVEGAELAVLNSLVPATPLPFSVALVEQDGRSRSKDTLVNELLSRGGMRSVWRHMIPSAANHLFAASYVGFNAWPEAHEPNRTLVESVRGWLKSGSPSSTPLQLSSFIQSEKVYQRLVAQGLAASFLEGRL